MNGPRVPISQLLTDKSLLDDPNQKKTREDWRKTKELEEARKAGNAPAAQDEEGRDINPHIPQYISAAPWYYGTSGPTLKHQRPQEELQAQYSGIDEWYKKGVDTTKVATKFRKGACENCGAMTHKKKDCLERPRKVGAKFSNALIAHDEFVQPDLKPDFDGKRDRWAGYDPANHREIVEEYQKIEEAKRELKAEKLKQDPNASSDEEEDEDKYADGVDMPGTKVDSKQRITVRNLRIREDTAKYLRNLDPNSAFYDPKTRSMRENPNPVKNPEDVEFAGENFVRYSGDTQRHANAQLFAWEAHGKGVDVHVLAEPTKLELLQKEYDSKKEELKDSVKDNVLQKYGGEEYIQVPPKQLLLAQTETYVEYARDGKIIKGAEKQIIRSRYEEDVLINNHTLVWGSFWKSGEWGYKCCHSFIKNSWCCKQSIGAETSAEASSSSHARNDPPEVREKSAEKEKSPEPSSSSSSSSSSDDAEKRRSRKRQRSEKSASSSKVFKCDKCSYQTNRKENLTKHEGIHNKSFECECCQKKFAISNSLKIHQMQHKHGIYATANETFDCSKCDKLFSTSNYLRVHQRNVHDIEKVQCNVCEKVCKNRQSLRNHNRNHFKAECPICLKMIPKASMALHVRTHTAETFFECDICGSSCRTKGILKQHIERVHLLRKLMSDSECCKDFGDFELLEKLQREYGSSATTSEKKFKCNICSRSFVTPRSMIQHKKEVHTDKTFGCETCKKAFKSKDQLSRHKASVHSKVPCPICKKKVGQRQLKSHMKFHQPDNHFECDLCGFNTKWKMSLARHTSHLQMHFNRDLKAFIDDFIDQNVE